MKKKSFIKNAFILTGTALLLRTIGIFFRIYMSNVIGAEGVGLYQLIFSIYVLAATFASSGISIAVTRLITDELVCGTPRSVRHILRRAIGISLTIGLFSMVAVYACADVIGTYWLKDFRAVPALKILSASLPFMGISCCLKGYFMARRRVATPSRAQIFEQLIRIGIVFMLLTRFAPYGITWSCAAVLIGDTLAEAAACLYLLIGYLRDRGRLPGLALLHKRPTYKVFRRLMAIAAPITAGRYLNSLLRTIENILVPDCLSKYTGSKETSLAQFGMLKGMAMPLIFFPSSFLSALSTLLIPEISEANALHQKGKVERAIRHTLHITLTVSILLSGLFFLFSKELGLLVYGSKDVGFLLGVLAPLMPFMYAESVVDGILKGLNQQISSLKYSVIDSLVRIALIFLLVPLRGMEGFLFVMIVSNLLTAWLNLRRLLIVTKLKMEWAQWLVKPALAMGVSGALVSLMGKFSFLQHLPMLASVVIGCVIACLVYMLLLPMLGCVTREDLHVIKD